MEEGERQYVKYSFYRVDPAWRRLPEGERDGHRRELEAGLEENADVPWIPDSAGMTSAELETSLAI